MVLLLRKWKLGAPNKTGFITSQYSTDLSLCDHLTEDQLNQFLCPLSENVDTISLCIDQKTKTSLLICSNCSIESSDPSSFEMTVFFCDGYLLSEVSKALQTLPHMRYSLFRYLSKLRKGKQAPRRIALVPCTPTKSVIDNTSCNRFSLTLKKRIVLEEAMAWLSTLGGGFSCLGDQFCDAAEIAGDISMKQLQLAVELGDPLIQTKCRLWYSQSLMQRGQLRSAARLLRRIYRWHWNVFSEEEKIHLMCQGLWHRLKFFWKHRHEIKRKRLYDDLERIVGSI